MNQKNEPKETLWTNTAISWTTALLIFLIAAGSFVLSYNNLHETAMSYGIPTHLAWIWPLLIDFALIVMSLAVVRASLYNERVWWPWTLVAIYTIATVSFNIAHAPATLQAQIVAAIAPISLFLSFELLMGQLKNGVIRKGLQVSLAELKREFERIRVEVGLEKDELGRVKDELQQANGSLDSVKVEFNRVSDLVSQKVQEVSDLETRAGELLVQIERLTAQKNELKHEPRVEPKEVKQPVSSSPDGRPEVHGLSERQQQLLDLLGRGLTQAAMAGELGVSVSTVKRELAGLNGLAEGAKG